MIQGLYKCFDHWHADGTTWLYSDPHFGDTDTICAIAGGLCMAYYREVSLDIEKILHENNVEKF